MRKKILSEKDPEEMTDDELVEWITEYGDGNINPEVGNIYGYDSKIRDEFYKRELHDRVRE